jgi:protein SCO1/2
MIRSTTTLQSARAAAVAAVFACIGGASAQLNLGVPEELKGVDIIEKLDAQLPLDARFTNDAGEQVSLRDYFKGDKPVLLQIGYNRCPMLCSLVLNGTFDALKGVDWTPGDQFEVVSVSIDPAEAATLAKAKKEAYLADFDRPGASKGVHFLTGTEIMSKSVADAVGFGYTRQPDGEYAHAAAIFLVKPDGKVSRYMYGAKFDPKDLRMALLEASQGRIGSTLDRFILWCHVYDPDARGYVLQARKVMSLGGLLTVLVLAGGLTAFWRVEFSRKKKTVAELNRAANSRSNEQ